ncbi:sensor histidine kinase [Romboutsia ilealis]|uniref:Sensor histidine kinase n=1 Tax=Romboutsia faecis TaxID=2764597 RepID=A0ABR7JJX8_9FIRM|nr:sensor histidine kinase [Romboutsia faecis]MBC5995220.1 sensor histidine kinase [Romboutsia faecis]MRN24531.1 sensor histidine kinase [Romboutsia ilealis]
MENKIISKLRETKISERLLKSFFILSIVPIILMFLVVNTTTINLIKNNIISNDKVASKLISDSISNYISRFDSITNEIIWNTKLLNNIKFYNDLSIEEKTKFNDEMAKILRSRTTYISDVADFTILNQDLNVVYNEGVSYIKHDIKLYEINKGLEKSKTINWTAINQGSYNYIAITKPIKIGKTTYGYLFLAIKEKVIVEMFKNYNENFNGYGVVLDENNNVVASNNKIISDYESNNSPEKFKKNNINQYKNINIVKDIDKFTKIIKYNGKRYIATTKPISYASWRLIGVIPYEYIYLSCINIYKTYVFVCIAVIGMSIFIAMLIYKSIANPMNEVVNAMNSVSEKNIGDTIPISGNDEISTIMKRYNVMSQNIKSLVHTVKVREKEKREITLRMLQAQINPHFLFNTLGSLRYVAMMNNDNVVANGLEALAKLLRSTIVNKDEFISVRDEIENVKNYITINKIRYGDTYNIDYEIEECLLEEKILKFILQPLIENCILHGFEEHDELNSIKIKISDGEEFLYFEIIDNGVGINENKLEEGFFNIDKFAGIGVKNVRERLSLYYEGIFTFEITSKQNKGTVTKIVIPKIIGG